MPEKKALLRALRDSWARGYAKGMADARCQCTVCPNRFESTGSVLIGTPDLLRRGGIQN